MFNKTRQKIAEWIWPLDTAALTRKNLNGVDLEASYDELPQEEYKEFLTNAGLVFKNKAFKRVIDHFIASQVEYAAKQAQDVRQLDFARASINGMTLVYEEFERLNGLYIEMVKSKETYDKWGIL